MSSLHQSALANHEPAAVCSSLSRRASNLDLGQIILQVLVQLVAFHDACIDTLEAGELCIDGLQNLLLQLVGQQLLLVAVEMAVRSAQLARQLLVLIVHGAVLQQRTELHRGVVAVQKFKHPQREQQSEWQR